MSATTSSWLDEQRARSEVFLTELMALGGTTRADKLAHRPMRISAGDINELIEGHRAQQTLAFTTHQAEQRIGRPVVDLNDLLAQFPYLADRQAVEDQWSTADRAWTALQQRAGDNR